MVKFILTLLRPPKCIRKGQKRDERKDDDHWDYDDVDKLDGICLIHSACRWRHFNAFVRVEFEDYSSEAYVLLIPR